MKIGDFVFSTKVRPNERAKITKVDIKLRHNPKTFKAVPQTTYTAKFEDGSSLIFYGFDINRTIFKTREADGQHTLEDYLGGNFIERTGVN